MDKIQEDKLLQVVQEWADEVDLKVFDFVLSKEPGMKIKVRPTTNIADLEYGIMDLEDSVNQAMYEKEILLDRIRELEALLDGSVKGKQPTVKAKNK